MVEKNRAELIKELEEVLGTRVFAIVYRPQEKGGIKKGDEIYLRHHFIEEIIKKEKINECIFIIEGMGGNLKTGILCSELLRKNLKKYSIFVPTLAASALCYFILQSDNLILGKKSTITQIDAIFEHNGKEFRAIKNLNHPDPLIRDLARQTHNPLFELIKTLLRNQPHVFKKGVAKRSQKKTHDLNRVATMWMAKEHHDSPITAKDLIRLEVNFKKVGDEVINLARQLTKECRNELDKEQHRFVIQTSKIEDGLHGGFFYP